MYNRSNEGRMSSSLTGSTANETDTNANRRNRQDRRQDANVEKLTCQEDARAR
jgi:hypothetical protein